MKIWLVAVVSVVDFEFVSFLVEPYHVFARSVTDAKVKVAVDNSAVLQGLDADAYRILVSLEFD